MWEYEVLAADGLIICAGLATIAGLAWWIRATIRLLCDGEDHG